NKLKQEKDVEKLYNIQRKLTEQIDAIEIAETMQVAAKALTKAVGILNQYATVIESLNVEDIIADSEESMAIIDETAELMGESTQDILVDEQLTQELELLQTEVALDMGSKLATTPEADVDTTITSGPEVVTSNSSDDLKRELERLKKELEM
nr:Snf7 family protein [Candidatus Sigynarchaeota archaeon]